MTLHIAVGVLRRGRQVLISQRRAGKPGAGQWEFPGGKCEPGESVQAALRRELAEELGIEVRRRRPLIRLRHHYPDREVLLDTWLVDDWGGEPVGREGQAIRWLDVPELSGAGLLEADRPIVAALELPSRYAFTPPDMRIEALKTHWPAIPDDWLVRLRLPSLDDAQYRALVLALWRQDGPMLAVDRPGLDWDADLPAGALVWHLPHRALPGCAVSRPAWARWRIASCHGEAERDAALAAGVDALVVGSVRPTPSHPGRAPMRWLRWRALIDPAGLPAYAIGGLVPADLDAARWAGATGVAGIRGFWN